MMKFTSTIVALILGTGLSTGSTVPAFAQLAKPFEANTTTVLRSLGKENDMMFNIVCRQLKANIIGAEAPAIRSGVTYLHGKRGQLCGARAGPHECTRVSCSWDSGIYFCNDHPEEIHVDCAAIGDLAQLILDKCTWIEEGYQWVEGEAFESDNWSVRVVSSYGNDGRC